MGKQTKYGQMLLDIHEYLLQEFKEKPQERKNAEDLSNFFNYIIYGQKNGELNKIFTTEVIEVLSQNIELKNMFKNAGENAYKTGEKGEQAFAKLIQQTVEMLSGQKINDSLLVGKDLTVVVDQISNESVEVVQQKLATELSQLNYKYYTGKQQKTDIKSIGVSLGLSSEAQWLTELSATVKNYSSPTVRLGSASNRKILQATLSGIKNMSVEEKVAYQKMLSDAKQVRVGKNDQRHLKHIRTIYELTGFGQMEEDLSKFAETPKYLIINKIGERIVVKSTNDLVKQILDEAGQDVHRFGKGKTISYTI